jgi:exopolyphosphatase/guanosine-5'-triphosphate,3'-diphosphate pyrophosphatase
MPLLGAIDVGTNAVRLAVGRTERGEPPEVVDSVREPLRLGADVFAVGAIEEATVERAVAALARLRGQLDRHGVTRWRAVATSALREARNRDHLLERARQASGIDVEVIPPDEEARLVCLAVAQRVVLAGRTVLLVDLGGGSAEISLVSDGRPLVTESFPFGSTRLLQQLRDPAQDETRFVTMVRESVDAARERLHREIGREAVDLCVGTGGTVERLAGLRDALLRRGGDSLGAAELEAILRRLERTPLEERVRRLGLRPDRADDVVPAAIVLQRLLAAAPADRLLVPGVGLTDGLLIDLAASKGCAPRRPTRDLVIAAALRLGRKLRFDEGHGTAVSRLAVALFDATRPLHALDEEARLLLEVAALLHDAGYLVGASGHHKHALYLLGASPLPGLAPAHRAVVANVARYHRKAFPSLTHEPYRALPPRDRIVVSKLASILRLADALDKERAGKVRDVRVEIRKARVELQPVGTGDLLLETWALARKAALFESVFGVRVAVRDVATLPSGPAPRAEPAPEGAAT